MIKIDSSHMIIEGKIIDEKRERIVQTEIIFISLQCFAANICIYKGIKSNVMSLSFSISGTNMRIGAVPAYKFSEGDGEIQLCKVDHTHDLLESETVLLTSTLIRKHLKPPGVYKIRGFWAYTSIHMTTDHLFVLQACLIMFITE
jgi:hypothetical protein